MIESADSLPPPLAEKLAALCACLESLGSCAVAFSGGVDSAVVAKAATLVLGDRAIAVTAASASLASGELEAAARLAAEIGIAHRIIHTQEIDNPAYQRNGFDRCYHCKSELYDRTAELLPDLGVAQIVNGANADDAADYRPGMRAASERQVQSPLLECGLTKADVRALARYWKLPVWDKPATPCLSSRIAYGEAVTPERLAMIDAGERYLRSLGLVEFRLRYHSGDIARLELPLSELPRFCTSPLREQVSAELRRLGFRFVTIDLEGFRSGSLNQAVPKLGLPILG